MEQKVRECKRCELFMAMKDMQTKHKALQQNVLESKSTVEVPDVNTQKSFVANQLQKPLIKGETWYIIDAIWFKQWKSYVGYESKDHCNVSEESAHPGPIDNTPILQGYVTIENMTTLDLALKQNKLYVMCVRITYFGLSFELCCSGKMIPLPRNVIEEGTYSKSLKVEIYLWHLKICENSKPNVTVTKLFSRIDTIRKLEEKMRREFSIPNDKEVRLWNRFMRNLYEQLNSKDKTLQDAGLYQGQIIVIEQKNPDGTWPREMKKNRKKMVI
ncbi:ubiquitin carboxyl-terminal hydrolase 15-like [Ruditapes philippinarum]|uniref:ubiquitin carboxyl-terminal hydrolase 15-like n=1 Tax=Ruditapes philippinarum TaxID=129788 RepID=UPI00295AC04F|nr:ubiquitin carboxyl-terminal hydrolase 15-like [Ruditapes philippinarum]